MENVVLDLTLPAYQGASMGLKLCGNSYFCRSFIEPTWKTGSR